jgi:hypothetical protein
MSNFLALFEPDAPWKTAASKVRVLLVTTQFIVRANDADLVKTFEGLKARNISLAVAVGFLYGGGHCGSGVEGYAAEHTARLLATRIKKLGGNLAYTAMDEPLWFGRHANGPTACHASIATIVNEIAEGVAEIHGAFPSAQIGDIEPIGEPSPATWTQEIRQFATAYRAAVGSQLAFIQADVQWSQLWRPQLRAVAEDARAMGIPLGVIVDSDIPGQSNTDWTQHAKARLADSLAALGRVPDQLIFESWQVHPTRFLPEDEPGTLTNLLKNTAP